MRLGLNGLETGDAGIRPAPVFNHFEPLSVNVLFIECLGSWNKVKTSTFNEMER